MSQTKGDNIAILRHKQVGIRVSDRDLAWFTSSQDCPPDERAVYTRYLERHRRHRLVGGLFGVAFAVSVGISWFGTVTFGVGDGTPLADVLFCGLAGVVVGTLSAESFRLSDPVSTTVTASLTAREDYSPPEIRSIAHGIVVAAVAVGALVAATGNGLAPLLLSAGGATATLLAERTQAAISGRRRPVLSDRAKAADLRMRSFASRSVATLQLAMAILVAGWTISKVPSIDDGLLALIRLIVVLASLVVTLILLRKAAPRPPQGWAVPT